MNVSQLFSCAYKPFVWSFGKLRTQYERSWTIFYALSRPPAR